MARASRSGIQYNEAFVEEVCTAIENSHKGLRSLCNDFKHWPPARTIRDWIAKYPHFSARYARAKEVQIENLAEEIVEISDNDQRDILEVDGEYGRTYVTNSVAVARDRLRTDNRKWIASKLLPKKYGDKKEEKENDNNDFVSLNRDKIVE